MPKSWSEVPLASLCAIASGGTPSKSVPEYWDGDIPWISGASMHAQRITNSERKVTQAAIGNGTRLAPTGSTLVLVRGMALLEEIRIGHVVRKVAFNQDVKALIPEMNLVDPNFLTYSLLACRPKLLTQVHQAGHGTGVLATDRLMSLSVATPPLAEQRRIAEVLGALDDLIEVNQGLINDLMDISLATYHHAVERSSVFRRVADVATFENNKRVPLSAAQRLAMPGNYPYFGAASQMDRVGEYLFDGARVLVGEDGSVITSANSPVVQFVTGKYWVNNHAHVLSGSSISTELLRIVLLASDVSAVITGAVQPKLNMGNLKSVEVRVPLDPEVDEAIQRFTDAELALRAEISELESARDELLPLLMSGRIRVGEDVAA